MKNSFVRVFAILLCLLTLMAGGTQIFADAFQTYTYSIDGLYMLSPDAYRYEDAFDYKEMGLNINLHTPTDMEVDQDGDIYIADSGNNRIVVLDGDTYQVKFEITEFTNDHGSLDSLKSPSGVFVKGNRIYVADTNNARIVIFEKRLNQALFYKIVNEPKSSVIEEDQAFVPIALAVDDSGRMYVVSRSNEQGIVVMTEEGAFVGFIGAQKVTYSLFDMFFRRFQTDEQRAADKSYVPTLYNNITIDDRGFIYATINFSKEDGTEGKQQSAITGKEGDYAPVRKFNSSGDDILKRNGFFAPSGEVDVLPDSTYNAVATGASKIVDVALGPEGTWSIIDEKRMKIFTYDTDGKLLFIFGDQGNQLGNLRKIKAITYSNDRILVLDDEVNTITSFYRTDYGDTLVQALKDANDRKYDNSVENWKTILQRNNNFDAAYIGIGRALYREGNYEESMVYYKSAYDTQNYSDSFKEVRKQWVEKYIWVIPIVVIAAIVGIVAFFKFAGKVNKRVAVSGEKQTFWKKVLYAFHVMFHPFDGFWDLKHEKRGSLGGAFFFIGLTVLAFTYNGVGKAYIFNPRGSTTSIIMQVISVIVPLILWVTANWCLTTLMDGEGSYKDIFIATGYALAPIPLLMIPVTAATHVLSASESGIVTLLIAFAWIWAGLLLLFGMQVTHDYTLFKNIITTILTIVGMVFIMFLIVLFSTLITKLVGFISGIVVEITYR